MLITDNRFNENKIKEFESTFESKKNSYPFYVAWLIIFQKENFSSSNW